MSVLLQYQLNQSNQGDVQRVREAPFRLGGLNICLDGLGHLFREELSKFKWAYSCFWGGLNACPDGLGHLMFSEAYNPAEW